MTDAVAPWSLGLLLVALALGVYRMLRGPERTDRLVALDFVALLVAVIMGLLAIQYDEEAYLSVALVVVLVTFLGIVALSWYVRHQAHEPTPSTNEEGPQ